MTVTQQARENRQYLRSLLGEREPAFSAMLRAVEWQINEELSRGARRESAHPCGRRHIMNTARLYHLDNSECVDGWTCREQEHTSVPPRCGAPVGCELPKGHPGPHLYLADRKRWPVGDAANGGNAGANSTGATGRGHPSAARPESLALTRAGLPAPDTSAGGSGPGKPGDRTRAKGRRRPADGR